MAHGKAVLNSAVSERQTPNCCSIAVTLIVGLHNSILYAFILQTVDGLYQLSQSTRLDRVPSLLEIHDCGSGNSRLARETLGRKVVRLCPDLIQIFCVDHSFVLAASLVGWVQQSVLD